MPRSLRKLFLASRHKLETRSTTRYAGCLHQAIPFCTTWAGGGVAYDSLLKVPLNGRYSAEVAVSESGGPTCRTPFMSCYHDFTLLTGPA